MTANMTWDATARQNDASEHGQLGHRSENLSQSVHEMMVNSTQPTGWTRGPQEDSLTHLSTDGHDSLYQDHTLPAGLASVRSESGERAQPDDPSREYAKDVHSLLKDSSSLLRDIGTLVSSNGADPSAGQLQMDHAALDAAKWVVTYDGRILDQFNQMSGFDNAVPPSNAGTEVTALGSVGTQSLGSDVITAATPGTTSPQGTGSDVSVAATPSGSSGPQASGSDVTLAAAPGTTSAPQGAGSEVAVAANTDGTVPQSSGSDASLEVTPVSNVTAGGGGIVTGVADGSPLSNLPQTSNLQILANAMQNNAVASGESTQPAHGTPITLATGDATPGSGTVTDAAGNVYSLAPMGTWRPAT